MSDTDKSYSLGEVVAVGAYAYTDAKSLFGPGILRQLLAANGTKKLKTLAVNGILTQTLDSLLSTLQGRGGMCVIENVTLTSASYVYVWDGSYLSIGVDIKANTIGISGLSMDPDICDLVKVLEKDYVSTVKKNLIFTIVKSGDGLMIKNLGDGSSPLMKDNYLPEVLDDIDVVLKSFSKVPPSGRICILNGEPGTGKTHLIRSILSQLDCVFLIVPSNMIEALDKPELLPLLLSVKEEHNKPIIMIIEDGDVCLVPRKSDNMSSITSLLNLSDGILGTIMDIKMIISTNADIREMDQAILRPGRLCKNIHVGPLPYEQANKVYQRLTKDDTMFLENKRFYTLAEIYDRVNRVDNNANTNTNSGSKKQPIGFGQPLKSNHDLTLNKVKVGFGS